MEIFIPLFYFCSLVHRAFTLTSQQIHCDVIIAGGSTAALAAAISAARRSPAMQICLTEPTDWVGGQLTSSGVPAIDFGPLNRERKYQASDFAEMLASLGAGNPGNCWVSAKCYQPKLLLDNWIKNTLASYRNLTVLYNTVIKKVLTDGRHIVAVDVVRRYARPGRLPWSRRYSESISDWYSDKTSPFFSKSMIRLVAKTSKYPVVIEATELGDVLVLAKASFRQGVESPFETSLQTLDTCGQAFTFPFYMKVNNHSVSGGNWPNSSASRFSLGTDWGKIWSYRRVLAKTGLFHQAKNGEVSNQNWGSGNDYKNGYLFLSLEETKSQRADWFGGVNLKSLAEAEIQAYGWYWYYRTHAPSDVRDRLTLETSLVGGTETGLSKIPYIRDSRRSVGMDNFMLTKDDMTANYNSPYGINFTDSISLGNYDYADVHGMYHCVYPRYVNVPSIKRFTIPFRALTNKDFDNLLVAGKTMAQTFMANAATRLHPMEWNTGLAAGLSASMMASDQLSTRDVWERVSQLQAEILNYMPIQWSAPENADNTADLIVG